MLLVKVRVQPSAIDGLGLFAAEPIRKGQEVWRFTPGFDLECARAEVERLPELWRERLLHYGYVDSRLDRYILCCDDARFINHSDSPTLAPDHATERHGVDRATRDIAVGEELTVDYGLIEAADVKRNR